jgi:hypothetical protein
MPVNQEFFRLNEPEILQGNGAKALIREGVIFWTVGKTKSGKILKPLNMLFVSAPLSLAFFLRIKFFISIPRLDFP